MNRSKSFQIQKTSLWPYVVGIDISATSLKYVVLRHGRTGTRIEGYGKHQVDLGGETGFEKLRQIIRGLFHGKSALQKAKIVLGVEGSGVVLKKESFPSLGKKELAQTIFFTIQQELGSDEETGSAAFDFIELGADENQQGYTTYLCMGMSEALIEDHMSALTLEQIIPDKIIPSVAAMANLLPMLPPGERQKQMALLDIGANRSMLVFINDGKIQFHREIVVGGNDITKAITGTIFHEGEAIQFDQVEADEFKRRFGYPMGYSESMTFRGAPLVEVGTMIRPVVERLIGEIQRSIDFYQEKFEGSNVELIYLVGGGARTKHLAESLSDKVGLPVYNFPMSTGLKVAGGREEQERFESRFLELTNAMGLALERTPQGNLLPLTYKKANQQRVFKKVLQWAALAICTVMALWSISLSETVLVKREQVTSLEEKITLSTRNTGFLNAALEKKQADIMQRLSDLDSRMQPDEAPVEILRMISNVMPSSLALTHVSIGGAPPKTAARGRGRDDEDQQAQPARVVNLLGWTNQPANDVGVVLAQLIVDLENSGYFTSVKLDKEYYGEDRKEYRFSLTCAMR